MSNSSPFRVVIAGGGVAALEAALALRELGPDAFDVTIVAPSREFVVRPQTVREPFAYARAHRYPLAELVAEADATLIEDAFARVAPADRIAHTSGGRALPYDALLLATGAKPYASLAHATTIDDSRLDEALGGIISDIELGYSSSVAFVAPSESVWPLPLYELALMTAARAASMGEHPSLTIVTAERTPLGVFGITASATVSALLFDHGIAIETSAMPSVPEAGKILIAPGDRLVAADRIVALPQLVGPSVRGIPAGANGFIPIDDRCRVRGTERLFGAGDATDFGVKHGGLAAQAGAHAAAGIAFLAGAGPDPGPLRPTIDGLLLTGATPLRLHATLVGGTGFWSSAVEVAEQPLPPKIAARRLAPLLERLDARTAGLGLGG